MWFAIAAFVEADIGLLTVAKTDGSWFGLPITVGLAFAFARLIGRKRLGDEVESALLASGAVMVGLAVAWIIEAVSGSNPDVTQRIVFSIFFALILWVPVGFITLGF